MPSITRALLTPSYTMKDYFFDRAVVLNRITDREAKALSRIGAYIRQAARQDFLRRRQRVSSAGESPSVHSTDKVATLRNILFGYDPTNHSVVVGPVKLNMQTRDRINLGSTTVPHLMEFGGVVEIQEEQWIGSARWWRRDLRRRPSENKRYRRRGAIYRPRPFMRPALEKVTKQGVMRDAFRGFLMSA